MTTGDALHRYFLDTGILEPGATRRDWYRDRVVWLRLGRFRIPLLFVLDRNGPLVLHDLHHMLTGYRPDWRGEVELAAWEIGSGGCRWHGFYWLDRLSLLAVGMLTMPRVALRALRRGRVQHNLYGCDPREVLEQPLGAVRRRVAPAAA